MKDQIPFDISRWAERLSDFMTESLARPAPPDGHCFDHEFNGLALELWNWQRQVNPILDRWAAKRLSHPVTDWQEIPALPAVAFKEFDVSCIPTKQRTAIFCSSGTTGRATSRHFHHGPSLALYERSLALWFERHVVPDAAWPRLLFLTPPPVQTPQSSLVHMFDTVRRRPGCQHALFGGRMDPETRAWDLNMPRVESVLRLARQTREPIAILGTAFNFVQLLDDLEARGERLSLPEDSRVMETGGYKGRTRSIPKADLHAWMTDRLGIPPTRIVCEYGMSELSSQAYDHRMPGMGRKTTGASTGGMDDTRVFRFPPWARARLVSPETGREVEDGEAGLIEVIDLANAWSCLALRTEDLGVRHEDGFLLLGRIPQAEAKGCSLNTLDRQAISLETAHGSA